MSGYFRLGQVISSLKLGQFRSVQVRLCQDISGYFRLYHVTSGYVRLCQVRSGL